MRFVVIMAGGRGERLWPLSTKKRPKQFLKLTGERTLLQETVERVTPLVPYENNYVVVDKEHVELVLAQLPGLPPKNVIVEPMGRGTAPCAGLAALRLSQIDPGGVMILLPADHVIKGKDRFLRLLEEAAAIASEGTYLVTLGITPDRPATGYGYIQALTPWSGSGSVGGSNVLEVDRFTEKPEQKTAERFLREGGYFWNSGMFIWRVDTLLHEIMVHMPNLHTGLMTIETHIGAPDYEDVLERVYREQDVISIDYGVMEKSDRVLVLPADIGWSDVGDWAAVDQVFETDEQGNLIQAHHLGIDTGNSVILSENAKVKDRLIATLGVADLVIVDTDDVLLVMNKGRSQEVKRLIQMREAEKEGEELSS